MGPIADLTQTSVTHAATVEESKTLTDHWKAVARRKTTTMTTSVMNRAQLDSNRFTAALLNRWSVKNTELAHNEI
jgi:hypothetical protein